jgi:hypothetical protein
MLVLILSSLLASSVFSDLSLSDARIITNLPSSSIYTCFFLPNPNAVQYVVPTSGICAMFPPGESGTISVYDSGVSGNVSYIKIDRGFVNISEMRLQYVTTYNTVGSYFLIGQPSNYVSPEKLISFTTGSSKLSITPSHTGHFGIYVPSGRSITLKYIAIDKAIPVYPFIAVGKEYSKEEVANEPPSVTIESPSNDTIVDDSFYIQFTAVDPEGRSMVCYYAIDNGPLNEIGAITSGSSVKVLINNIYIGRHLVTIKCFDPHNAVGEDSIYVVNGKAPSVVIVDPRDGDLVRSKTLTVYYYVGDDHPNTLNCALKIDGENVDSFDVSLSSQLTPGQRSIDLSSYASGTTHTLTLSCVDEDGLSSQHTISFKLCLDPDDCEEYCKDVGGEWYGVGHCCGDDEGEHLSTEAKPGQAFDPETCSIIDLAPGQCDGVEDCGINDWYCADPTTREHRIYSCVKDPGELIGTCQYVVNQTEDCTTYGSDYFCSSGQCVNISPTLYPPVITIIEPSDGSTVEVPLTQKYLDVIYKVTDDTSLYTHCTLKYLNKSVYLGLIPANGSLQTTQIMLDTNVTSYTITIECTDKDNMTSNTTSSFTVSYTYSNACRVDEDCGVSGWVCSSENERKYITYKCVEGACTIEVTQVESCPEGTYCHNGQCVEAPECHSDSDCPADEWVCVNGTMKEFRNWYCNTTSGRCEYTVDKTETCPNGTTCLSGVCHEEGSCPGPTYVCVDNHTRAEIVWYYDSDLKKCVGVELSHESCPAGMSCVDGKCGGGSNLPPSITIISPANGEEVSVGEPVTIKFKVTDDNTLAILTRVYVIHSPPNKIFENLVTASQEAEVSYVPKEEGTYVIKVEAFDGYGASSSSQVTIEAVPKEKPPSGGGGGAPSAPIPTTAGTGAGIMPSAMMVGREASPLTLVIAAIVIGAVVVCYYYLRRRY